jgi:hypothetical protein
VNATKTLEIVRMDSGSTFPTTFAGMDTYILPVDEGKSLRWMLAVRSEVYDIQTKAQIHSANYFTRLRIIILAPGWQILGRTTASCLLGPPVLPAGLLEKIFISPVSTLSAAQALEHILSGADQFADWKSGWKELTTWWFRLLGDWGPVIAVTLLLSFLLIITPVIILAYYSYQG